MCGNPMGAKEEAEKKKKKKHEEKHMYTNNMDK